MYIICMDIYLDILVDFLCWKENVKIFLSWLRFSTMLQYDREESINIHGTKLTKKERDLFSKNGHYQLFDGFKIEKSAFL